MIRRLPVDLPVSFHDKPLEGRKGWSKELGKAISNMAASKIKSPYRKGYLKELEVMRILRRSGKFQVVFRSAASHSPFDIVAISKRKVLLLQVKTGKFNLKRELEKLRSIKTPKSVEKQLWILNKEWKVVNC